MAGFSNNTFLPDLFWNFALVGDIPYTSDKLNFKCYTHPTTCVMELRDL